ncbi:hypothetical protein GCM10025795_15680 [Verticiella sediminum]
MRRALVSAWGPRMATQPVIGTVCGVLAIMLFASFTLVSRMGFSATALTLPDMAMLRFAVAGLVLLPVLIRRGLGPLRWLQAALLVMTGGLGFALFAYAGFRLAPASHGGVLLHGTIPLLTLVLVRWCSKTPGRATGWAGPVLIQTGILIMVWDSVRGAPVHQWLGDGALLLAALCWSAYGLLNQRWRLAPVHSVAIVATGSLACFAPVYLLVLPASGLRAAPWHDVVFQGVFQGLLIGVVSGLLYTRAVASLGAQRTALFTAAVPCVTTGAAVWLLDERPSGWAWAGVAAVTLGMAIAMRSRRTP